MISLIASACRGNFRIPVRNAITGCLLLGLAGIASAAAMPWRSLPPVQQEALAPLVQEWDTMPEAEQRRWLRTAKRYPQLTPKQKQRFSKRLAAWSKLTPEQRKAAREKYRAFNQVPLERREQVKRIVEHDRANDALQVDGGGGETPSARQR